MTLRTISIRPNPKRKKRKAAVRRRAKPARRQRAVAPHHNYIVQGFKRGRVHPVYLAGTADKPKFVTAAHSGRRFKDIKSAHEALRQAGSRRPRGITFLQVVPW